MSSLLKLVSLQTILTFLLDAGRAAYDQGGRGAVERLATIPEKALRALASKAKADPDAVVAFGRKFASAFADFVGAFIPVGL